MEQISKEREPKMPAIPMQLALRVLTALGWVYEIQELQIQRTLKPLDKNKKLKNEEIEII